MIKILTWAVSLEETHLDLFLPGTYQEITFANISSALFKNESTAQNLLVMSHFLIDEKYQKYRIAKVKDYISMFQQ